MAIKFCLEQAKIQGEDLDYVVFFEKPFRKLDRILMTASADLSRNPGRSSASP